MPWLTWFQRWREVELAEPTAHDVREVRRLLATPVRRVKVPAGEVSDLASDVRKCD